MNYEFGLNMDDSYKKYNDIDEWGMAVIDFGIYGAEYNFCVEEGDNLMKKLVIGIQTIIVLNIMKLILMILTGKKI